MKKPAQIIRVTKNQIGEEKLQTVNSRELWRELGVGKDYSNWIKAQIETLDFEENLDYLKVAQKGELSKTGQTEINYIFSLDAAKHIALASRTPRGKEVRKYFIEMEKYAKHVLQEKAITKNMLSNVIIEHNHIERRQEKTLELVNDFQEFNGKVVKALRNLLDTELNSILILNKALVDSIEEPTIKKMYVSITETIHVKRDFLLEAISNKVKEANKHCTQINHFSETKLKELAKDCQTVAERIESENAS